MCTPWVRTLLLTRLPTASEGHLTMPTLRRGAGRFLGTAVLAFFLPACSAPPVAPAGSGPLREQTIPHNPPVPEGQREIAISEGEKPTDTPKQPPTAEVRGGASGTDGPEARPWQARHGGSCGQRGDCWATLRRDFALGHDDYRNYYSGENLAELGLGIVAAAPLANTHADQAVRDWYQQDVRSRATDQVARVVKHAGEPWVTVPVYLVAELAERVADDATVDAAVGEWGSRGLRAMAVGVPPLLVLQVTLGASRPNKGDSHWHPFHDIHGVSGHSFVGAVPFLTAAMMAEDSCWCYPLVAASFLPGLSRINDDRHYLSQVALGWWMAYLATTSVRETATGQRWFQLLPVSPTGEPGAAVFVRY